MPQDMNIRPTRPLAAIAATSIFSMFCWARNVILIQELASGEVSVTLGRCNRLGEDLRLKIIREKAIVYME